MKGLTLARPIIKYSNTLWHPHFKSIDTIIEPVPRRVATTIHGTKNLSYPERLRVVNLQTLGHMIQVYKYLSGKYDVDTTQLFSIDQR